MNSLVCFDIDGVILAGSSAISGSGEAIKLLQNVKIPYMFLTNGGTCSENERILQLNEILNVDNSSCLIVMAQSSLKEMTDLHTKNVLFVGTLNVREIALSVGFQNIIEIEEIKSSYPLLDAVPKTFNISISKSNVNLPTIEAIVILEDPVNYETSIQLLIDVIFTHGTLDPTICQYPLSSSSEMLQRIPVLAMASDYLWTTSAPWPRLASGFFLRCLETYFESMCGGEKLKYLGMYGKPSLETYLFLYKMLCRKYNPADIHTIYFVGDNLLTDIYGANTFKRYIQSGTFNDISPHLKIYSILVKTGVYRGESIDRCHSLINLLNSSMVKDPSLLYPDYIFENALEATEFISKANET